MRFIVRALGNPAPEQFLLRQREGLMHLRWRHQVIFLGSEDAFHQLTFVRFTWNDGAFLEGSLPQIEAELALALVLVGTMTAKAGIGKNRPDVTVEPDFIGDDLPAENRYGPEEQSCG